VEQLLDNLCRLEMISSAILRIKLYGRMTNTMPEDMEELSFQLLHLNIAHCSPFETHIYSLRRYSSEELSRRVIKWRNEIAKEQPRYDAYLLCSVSSSSVSGCIATYHERIRTIHVSITVEATDISRPAAERVSCWL
jgi:hypothetical protein